MMVRSGMRAPAAMMEPVPMWAPLRTMAPMPMRTSSSRMQPWTVALWPMVIAPRQKMAVRTVDVSALPDRRHLRLGRGGFSVGYDGVLNLGKVAFRCVVESWDCEMSGEGYVQWRSKDDKAVGIEFVFLEEGCRKWLIAEMEMCKPRSFIPE